MHSFRSVTGFVAAACLISGQVDAGARQDARLLTATQVLNEMQQSPDQNVPHWLMERAYAVAIVPSVIKVGLGIGGRRGKGVMVVRKEDGHWTNPVFINLTGGSFGFQVGVQSTDVLLVFTSRQGVEGIVGGKVTLGADASVAAGPVGRQTSAATDVGLTAQVYSYSRASGLFLGVALDGSALTIDQSSDASFYEKPGILASEIVADPNPTSNPPAQNLVSALNQMAGIGGSAPAVAQQSAPSSETAPATPTSQPGESGALTTKPMEDPHPGAEPPL
jgi:lipid-binding SYLF domain-containing protein